MTLSHLRAALYTAGALLLSAGCSSEGVVAPAPAPAAIRSQSGNLQTGTAGAALPVALSVLVTDVNGAGIAGVRVSWALSAGSGTLAPATSTSNGQGVATTAWTVGTIAGTQRVAAQVNGLTSVSFTATVLAGAPSTLIATPELGFLGVGDTVRIRATAGDQFGNEVAGQASTFSSLNTGIATVNASGLVTALSLGTARIVAAAAGRADTVPITVLLAGASACGPVTPRVLAVGEVFIPVLGATSAGACVVAPAGVNAEYALTLISTAPLLGTSTAIDIVRVSNAPTTTAVIAGAARSLTIGADLLSRVDAIDASLTRPREVERARHEMARRELAPLVGLAREWYASRNAATDAPAGVSRASSVAEVQVGNVIRLNTNANQSCTNAVLRGGRVAAVGLRAIVVADTSNPAGGYTDADFRDIVATFDTLVYPLDTEAFGAPSNISRFGKILLFYTRAVNALTPRNANFTIGGFFFSRDLFPKTARNGLAACPESNESEMFYLLVPDVNGVVNGNRRSTADVSLLNIATIAHELQHLINSSRRLFVNTNAATNEETWLDEGLSHVAEELLYLRIAGYTSRQNLALTDVNGTPARRSEFRSFASQNFSRLNSYLLRPEFNSPYAPNDSLATRGAIWSFLRFAAGRQGAAGEAPFFRALVNSNTTGVSNLQGVLSGGQFADFLLDWTVSNIADDFSAATTAGLGSQYITPGWDFRSIYPGLAFGPGGTALGVYPLATRTLLSNTPQRITFGGGTSSYLRFTLDSGQSTLFTLSSNGRAPATTMRYAVVRLR